MPEKAPEIPMLFCHIAWMREYRGGDKEDTPEGGGSHSEKAEKYNYKEFDGYMYGYAPTSKRTFNLERLGARAGEESVPDVTVVWTAIRPRTMGGGRCVVGWYRNATVFRELKDHSGRGSYNVMAAEEDCILIPPNQRSWEIESKRSGRPGQAPQWYLDGPYGAKVKRKMSRLLAQEFDRKRLNSRTAELASSVLLDAPPQGVPEPISLNQKVTVWGRDPEVRAYALARARGKCQSCNAPAPFNTPSGDPFLEVHHVKQLADGGPDTIDNAVALCPNCHREAHFGTEKNAILQKLRDLLSRTSA